MLKRACRHFSKVISQKNSRNIDPLKQLENPKLILDYVKKSNESSGNLGKYLEIAIVGCPNAGKSSLINSLSKHFISAVSPKYNTTRKSNVGIVTDENVQLVFCDTPGICTPQDPRYYSMLVAEADRIVKKSNVILWITDIAKKVNLNDLDVMKMILSYSVTLKTPIFLIANKTDLLSKREVREKCLLLVQNAFKMRNVVIDYLLEKEIEGVIVDAEYIKILKNETMLDCSVFKGIFLTSMFNNENMEKEVEVILSTLKDNALVEPWHYSGNLYTNVTEQELYEEIVREQIYRNYHQDIPYKIKINTIQFTNNTKGQLDVIHEIKIPNKSLMKRMVSGLRFIRTKCTQTIKKEFNKDISLEFKLSLKD